ncbi:MAG: BTAD domain-containing putative transcriptional regulator [Chloroflexi bacterium]|nr:BTAD domain-containing putative transcriptional regulator [Chloroflexota bacterium]
MNGAQNSVSGQAAAQANARLIVRFLGPIQLQLDEQNLTAEIGAKPLALLAYLAVAAPHPVARERLVGILWADKAEDAARYRLRHMLWNLRRTLGKDQLQADDTLCWFATEGLWIDVAEFQRGCLALGIDKPRATPSPADIPTLQALVDLYRGDFFDRLIVREAPLFEEWNLAERERLQLLYLEVLWRLAQAQQAVGDEASCAQTLTRLIEADPLRERSYRALMAAYQRQGDRAAALRVYEQCKLYLARELAVPPSPETEQLRQSIVKGTLNTAPALLEAAGRALKAGRYAEALRACAAAEALAGDPNLHNEIVLLRVEIALARGRNDEALSLVQAARQALRHLIGQ